MTSIQKVVVGVSVLILGAIITGTFVLVLGMRILIAEQTVELRGINSRLSTTVSVDIFAASQTSTHARIGTNADDIDSIWTSLADHRRSLQEHLKSEH